MRKFKLYPQIYCLLFASLFITSCSEHNESNSSKDSGHKSFSITDVIRPKCNSQNSIVLNSQSNQKLKPDSALQIGEYVREIFQDRNGNLWFGTLMRGVARYDGEALVYFSKKDGLIGNQINGIAEDGAGNLWFATTAGVSKYDGILFTNFTEEQGLSDTSTWSILADSKGTIWVSTMSGVYRHEGSSFSSFSIPKADVENPTYLFSLDMVWCIVEDKKGDIWFGTDGLGACRYDGKTFSHFTKKDGLCSNDVASILEDKQGHIWFGSQETRVLKNKDSFKFVPSGEGGLSRYDGKTFTRFTDIEGLSGHDVYPLYEDKAGNIWIGSKHQGVYHYDGKKFTNFKENQGLTINNIQSILEDKDGKMWFGFSGGLFRFNWLTFINVTKDGPWP